MDARAERGRSVVAHKSDKSRNGWEIVVSGGGERDAPLPSVGCHGPASDTGDEGRDARRSGGVA